MVLIASVPDLCILSTFRTPQPPMIFRFWQFKVMCFLRFIININICPFFDFFVFWDMFQIHRRPFDGRELIFLAFTLVFLHLNYAVSNEK